MTTVRLTSADSNVVATLLGSRLPGGLRLRSTERSVYRDVLFDTPDAVLARQGVDCRLRYVDDGSVTWTIKAEPRYGLPAKRIDTRVTVRPPTAAFDEATPAGNWLRALVDPARLVPVLEANTDRYEGRVHWWGWPRPCLRVIVDRSTITAGSRTAGSRQVPVATVTLVPDQGLGPGVRTVADRWIAEFGLEPAIGNAVQRARRALADADAVSMTAALRAPKDCVVLLARDGHVGFRRREGSLDVFWKSGAGEVSCREILEDAFGTSQAQVRCLGQLPARPWQRAQEVWLARRLPEATQQDPTIEWIPLDRAAALAGTPALREPRALAALQVAIQADVMRLHTHGVTRPIPRPAAPAVAPETASERYLDGDLSLLEFNARVLALAADPRLPLPVRVSYLAIGAANLDEFVAVRVGALKRAQRRQGEKPVSWAEAPASRLDVVRIRLLDLQASMRQLLHDDLLPALAQRGFGFVTWDALESDDRRTISRQYFETIRPRLVPMAATPTHPFPRLHSFELALTFKLRHPDTGHTHYATVALPPTIPRFLPVSRGGWIPVERVIRGHAETLFPDVEIVDSGVFRVIRADTLDYRDTDSTDLLQQVADVIDGRDDQPVVRLDVERAMSADMRALLLQEFRFERPEEASDFERADVNDIEGLLSLRHFRDVVQALYCPVPFATAEPFPREVSIVDSLRAHDTLVHFPFDSFDHTVVRFLREAAEDPSVERMSLALYRTTADSPILEALRTAAAGGKTVVALVELKARFDESRNIVAARQLREAGVQVVYGVTGLKLHSKILQILRREDDGLRRYSYIGSGNFHPATARLYTDVGLFTADRGIGEEIAALVDGVTASTAHPSGPRLLVSPRDMLPRLVAHIDRATQSARAGRPARIRAKLNGLDDLEMIEALYRASAAGVTVWLSVRGICRLRPGVPGLSDRISVISLLGEFLEHARIIEVETDGHVDYLIGSADWRERNLRRRVEVMTPVTDRAAQHRLRQLLDWEADDAAAWHLGADGTWTRPGDAPPLSVTQARLRDRGHDPAPPTPSHQPSPGSTAAPAASRESPDGSFARRPRCSPRPPAPQRRA